MTVTANAKKSRGLDYVRCTSGACSKPDIISKRLRCRLSADIVAKPQAGSFLRNNRIRLRVRRIEIALRDSSTNQCCALRKILLPQYLPQADIILSVLGTRKLDRLGIRGECPLENFPPPPAVAIEIDDKLIGGFNRKHPQRSGIPHSPFVSPTLMEVLINRVSQ